MKQNNKNQQEGSSKKVNNIFFDEQTKQKIDKHLSDINDTISDQDIENVRTDITSGPSDSIGNEIDDFSENTSNGETSETPSSWNIID